MKKVIMVLILLTFPLAVLTGCGGGKSGSSSSPKGENPGFTSIVQLLPSHYIAQTNTVITLHAKVLDGNGVAVKNTTVRFTNLSPIGTLSATTAKTDKLGIATVTLKSTLTGFSTIQAEVDTAAGIVRDRKSVYFSSSNVLAVSMDMDVDSVPSTSSYNEPEDFILFSPPPDPDNEVEILATVRNAGGVPLAGSVVTWFADLTEASFISGVDLFGQSVTNVNGQAKVVVRVTPESIRNTETYVNIMAFADNGAANMVTLFLQPITVSTVTVTSIPSVIEPEGTTTVNALVMLNTGDPAPDGTIVNFSTTCGAITPFAPTVSGVATAEYIAPSTEGTCTITGTVGGVSGSTDVLVTTDLTVLPGSQTVNGITGGESTFTIYGGVAPYTITSSSSDPNLQPDPAAVETSGGSFTITVPAGTPETTVTYTVRDSVGNTVNATLQITGEALAVVPSSITVDGTAGGTAPFTIFGGTPGYTIFADTIDPNLQPNPATVAASGDIFSVTVPAGTAATTVTYTVRDSSGDTVTATLEITGAAPSTLSVTPSSATIAEGDQAIFVITGGTGTYTVVSSNPSRAYDTAPGDGTWGPLSPSGVSFTVTTSDTNTAAVVSLIVTDGVSSVTATLNLTVD